MKSKKSRKPKVLTAKVIVYTPEDVVGTTIVTNTARRSDTRFLTELILIVVANLGLDANNIQQYKFSISLNRE